MLTGLVRRVTGTDEVYLELENGDCITLVFENVERSYEVPLNVLLSIVVDENGVVPDIDKFYQQVELGLRNRTDKHIIVFNRGREDSDDEQLISVAKRRAKDLKDFWQQFSLGYWSVEATGYALKPELRKCNYKPRSYCAQEMIQSYHDMPEEAKPDWDPVYWHILGGTAKGLCGQATLGGSRGVTYGTCQADSSQHELGHNFGEHHARKRAPDGSIIEYGDPTSIMGNSSSRAGLNAVNMYRLGLYSEDEVNVITTNEQVIVCPHELDKEMRKPNEFVYNIVKSPTNRKVYFISNRKRKGHWQLYRTNEEGLIYIHERDNNAGSILEATLRVGEESDVIQGVTVKNLEFKNEVNKIEVEFAQDISRTTQDEIDTRVFPEMLNGVELSEVHDGMWYNPTFNGQGFDVFVKDNRLALYWYTYNTGRYSQPDWYLATAELKEGVEQFDIYTTKFGRFDNPARAETIKVGEGQIYFFNNDRGIFTYNTEEHGKGAINLQRLVAKQSENDGVFYDPKRNGEGLTVRFLNDGKKVVATWYTYFAKGNFITGLSKRWVSLDGVRNDDNTYTCKVLRTSGDFMRVNTDPVEFANIGEATLTVSPEGEPQTFKSTADNMVVELDLKRIF